MIAIAADRMEQAIGGRKRGTVSELGADQPGAAVHLQTAQCRARREYRAIAPKAPEAFGVLQGHRTGEAGPVERKVPVAGHVIELGGIAELGAIETGDALELGAGECDGAPEASMVEAGIAEKNGRGKIHRRVE